MKNDKPIDSRTNAYQRELDARVDALQAQLGEAPQKRGVIQRVLDAVDGRTKTGSGARRWALGAGSAVVAVGAGLSLAGSGTPQELPNAISLQDRVSVAEAAAAPQSDISVVPAPFVTLDASDSPFDDAEPAGAPGGSAGLVSASFDSPDDSPAFPSTSAPVAPLTGGGDSASSTPDDVTAPSTSAPLTSGGDSASSTPDDVPAPSTSAPSIAMDSASASAALDSASASSSPDEGSPQTGSPDSASASFDSPDNT